MSLVNARERGGAEAPAIMRPYMSSYDTGEILSAACEVPLRELLGNCNRRVEQHSCYVSRKKKSQRADRFRIKRGTRRRWRASIANWIYIARRRTRRSTHDPPDSGRRTNSFLSAATLSERLNAGSTGRSSLCEQRRMTQIRPMWPGEIRVVRRGGRVLKSRRCLQIRPRTSAFKGFGLADLERNR